MTSGLFGLCIRLACISATAFLLLHFFIHR